MKLGSLFAGVGGLDLACEAHFGATTAWQVEYDPACQKVLERHWPDAKRYGDVTTLDFAELEPVDILCGGYPCQPFSHAGKRKGTDDARHLWPHYARAIGVLRPRLAILENVAGHLSLGFEQVLADLAELGYDARWGVVRASDAGACHQRARVFVVAYPAGTEWRDAQRDAVGESRGAAEPGERAGDYPLLPSPRTSDANGAGAHGTGGLDLRTAVALLPTPTTQPMTGNGHARNLGREVALLPTPTARDWKDGSPCDVEENALLGRVVWDESRWGRYAEAIARHERALGRPAPEPCDERRRLSADFCEWMMMLPEGHTHGTRTQRLKMLGNAVVPAQAMLALW